ncbi:hypothetical protein ABPG74_011068 [Tetrahymena malaccensis]
MGNCCQNTSTKDEFEVEVLQQNNVKAQGNHIQAQLNSSRIANNKINADDSQNNHVMTSLANEEIKESGFHDRLDSVDGNGFEYENDYHTKHSEQQQQQQQNSIKNKFNLKIDLNKINNEISFSQNSEQDEPLMRRRKSSSENVHTQSQPDSSINQQQQQQNNSNYQQNQSSQYNSHNHQNGSYHSNQNKLYIEETDQYEPYQGPPVPKKQLNIKLDLEKINEQNENEEYNPNSLKRKY